MALHGLAACRELTYTPPSAADAVPDLLSGLKRSAASSAKLFAERSELATSALVGGTCIAECDLIEQLAATT